MEIFPFRLVSDSAKARIGLALGRIVDDWSAAWFGAKMPADLASISDTSALESDGWLIFADDAEKWFAWQATSESDADMLCALFNDGAAKSNMTGSLASRVLGECVADLAARCCLPEAVYVAAPYQGSLAKCRHGYGSGAIFVDIVHGSSIYSVAIGGGTVEAIAPMPLPASGAGEPLLARSAAIGNGRTRIEVVLGEAELPLGELVGMTAGDVIALDLHRSEPVSVRMADGQALFRARLGRRGDCKAIQIVN